MSEPVELLAGRDFDNHYAKWLCTNCDNTTEVASALPPGHEPRLPRRPTCPTCGWKVAILLDHQTTATSNRSTTAARGGGRA